MPTLDTAKAEAQAALAEVGTALTAAKNELEAVTQKVTGLGIQHAALSVMLEGGKVLNAVEIEASKVVADVKAGFSTAEKWLIKGGVLTGTGAALAALAKSLGLFALL